MGLSTSLAARAVGVALIGTAAVLELSVLVPRGFCAYICPLGTLIDLFDWLIGRGARRLKWIFYSCLAFLPGAALELKDLRRVLAWRVETVVP